MQVRILLAYPSSMAAPLVVCAFTNVRYRDRMSDTPVKSGRVLFVVLLILAYSIIVAGTYAVSYVTLGEYIDWRISPYPEDRTQLVERQYPQGWMATIFEPAARIESRWIGCEVMITYTETAGPALAPY